MRFIDKDHTAILTADGRLIPAVPGNRDWDALQTAGTSIRAYTPPPPDADDVRAEASRRMQSLLGARDARHLEIVVANGTREAVRLLRLRDDRPWTAEEAARAAGLAAVDQALESIRNASNALEAAPPADYASDHHWPPRAQ